MTIILLHLLDLKLMFSQNVAQFEDDFLKTQNKSGLVKTDIFLNYGYVYDAMWTIALTLNSSISILEDRGLGRLEDFTYDSVEMANVFTEAVTNVSFEGITVSENIDSNCLLNFFHYRDMSPYKRMAVE